MEILIREEEQEQEEDEFKKAYRVTIPKRAFQGPKKDPYNYMIRQDRYMIGAFTDEETYRTLDEMDRRRNIAKSFYYLHPVLGPWVLIVKLISRLWK